MKKTHFQRITHIEWTFRKWKCCHEIEILTQRAICIACSNLVYIVYSWFGQRNSGLCLLVLALHSLLVIEIKAKIIFSIGEVDIILCQPNALVCALKAQGVASKLYFLLKFIKKVEIPQMLMSSTCWEPNHHAFETEQFFSHFCTSLVRKTIATGQIILKILNCWLSHWVERAYSFFQLNLTPIESFFPQFCAF